MNEGTPSDAAAPVAGSPIKPLGEVIAINEALIKDLLNQVVVKTVEEALNAMLDAEADEDDQQGQVEFLRSNRCEKPGMHRGVFPPEIAFDRRTIRDDLETMTQKAKAIIDRFHAEQFALRDKVAARLATATPNDRKNVMVSAGILTKNGKLTPAYRQKKPAAA